MNNPTLNEQETRQQETDNREPESGHGPLFPGPETQGLRSRWQAVQGEFVDEPRRAVEEADQLVSSVIGRLSEVFAEEREKIEQQWPKGADMSTEDLRQALRRYRAFFDRLLAV